MYGKKEKQLKPVSKKVSLIVGEIAKNRIVEDLILKITHHDQVTDELEDLAQIIYFALLQTDSSLLEHLIQSRELNFYLTRMIMNQYYSANSPFYAEIRRFRSRSSEITFHFADSLEDKTANKY